ncbi:MAG: hypothetical protein PHV59_02865 [Victivallales bacterium]|nr:hypothetical protein [Victivallales bacterium]
MEKKKSLEMKIRIIFDNYGKPAIYIPFLVFGLAASFALIRASGSVGGLIGAVLGLFWGLIIARLAAPAIGEWFGNLFYAPRVRLETPPDILSPVKGLIAREEYAGALEELNELLEEKPFSPEPYLLLVELYADGLKDCPRAMALIGEYFSREKIYPFEENIEMLLLYADLCREYDCLDNARKLLRQEISRKGYPELKRKRLQTRLEAISLPADGSSSKI